MGSTWMSWLACNWLKTGSCSLVLGAQVDRNDKTVGSPNKSTVWTVLPFKSVRVKSGLVFPSNGSCDNELLFFSFSLALTGVVAKLNHGICSGPRRKPLSFFRLSVAVTGLAVANVKIELVSA